MGKRLVLAVTTVIAGAFLLSTAAVAQHGQQAQQSAPGTIVPGTLLVKALTERRVTALPVGRPRLYWRVDTFPSLAQAQAAAGPWAVAAEAFGRAWLFTLGPNGMPTSGGTKVVEVGPLPPVRAQEYLLRINEATGAPGSVSSVHTHPGVEAFYVLVGEACLRTPNGLIRIPAGQATAGAEADTPITVASCGSTDLRQLIMFVVDANRPFSSPAVFP
ncbi:MAG: cupin domain-containing protein [Armatimonadota bacterium]|nr:cupin domain-containing protein [Armatimonadota bacterium]